MADITDGPKNAFIIELRSRGLDPHSIDTKETVWNRNRNSSNDGRDHYDVV